MSRSHAPRVFGQAGRQRAYQARYKALEAKFGPFDAVTRDYAAGVCVLWFEFQKATAAVRLGEDARTHGKGRRPSAAAIERLKRRLGLSWQSYDQAMRRLEELAAQRQTTGPLDFLG